MNVRTGRIAGVDDCVLWRIGFTGELSYELHVPASYGLHVWETLLERGADLGAARVRRGGTADPAAGEGPLHRRPGHRRADQGLQRRPGLGHQAGQGRLRRQAGAGLAARRRASDPQLVGLQPVDGSVVPDEASLIIEGSHIAGRITSSRMSPTLGRSICLAQVEAAARRARHRGHRAAAERAPDHRDGHAAAWRTSTRTEGGCVSEPAGAQSRSCPRRAAGRPRRLGGERAPARPAALTLTDCTPLTKVQLRRRTPARPPPSSGCRSAGRARNTDGALVVGSGPGEWLLLSAAGSCRGDCRVARRPDSPRVGRSTRARPTSPTAARSSA